MNHYFKAALGMTAAVCVAGGAAMAIAQDGPPAALRGQGFQPGGGGFQGRGGPGGFDPAAREQMLQQQLNLRPDQAPALQAFLASSQPQRGGRRAEQAMTTPQRLDAQLAEIQARVVATKKFYASLTPEQKQTFDSMPALSQLGGPGGGRGGPGGRRGPGGPGGGFGGPGGNFGPPPQNQ